ncbi:MAG: carotenoid 1,2-hydratase, partial [Pseudomonadota bacterium]
VDGLSDCGTRGVSVIGFIGSVFSPWYRWTGRKRPHNHCCINVALYGPGGRFTMTERGQRDVRLAPERFEVGPSAMTWRDGALEIEVDEISNPLISRVRGRIRVVPEGITSVEVPLTPEGTHVWRPFAPSARIEVEIDRPGWHWQGHGYFDANFGTRALEDDFSYWTWGRFPVPGGGVAFYDAARRDGTSLELALKFGADGSVAEMEMPPKAPMRRSYWLVKRETRADPGYRPRQVQMMLEAPFYTRAAVRTQLEGRETVGVHEALDLNRFASPLLKPMLAVRVPRVSGWR